MVEDRTARAGLPGEDRMRPVRHPSRLISRLLNRHDTPKARAAIEANAATVRTYVEQNLLLGVMCLEAAPSDKAFASVVSALRVAKLAGEAANAEAARTGAPK